MYEGQDVAKRAEGACEEETRTEYIGRVPKWPTSVVHTIGFAKYVSKMYFECL